MGGVTTARGFPRLGRPGRGRRTRSAAPRSARRARRPARPAARSRAAASARSAAGTRPRCRLGASMPASRGRTPSTGSPVASIAATISSACRGEPALFRITPLSRSSRVEGVEPVHDGGGGAGHLADVQHQDHRGVDQGRDVGGRGEPLAADLAVEQPHHALDDGEVGRLGVARAVQQQRGDLVGPAQVRIQVAAGPAGGQGVVAGVDVVRADLEPGDLRPSRRKAPIRPVASVVLPCPEPGAAITIRGQPAVRLKAQAKGITIRCPAGPSGRRRTGA